MASNSGIPSPTYGSDPITANTTFVQADPSNFRAVVQKLTGASEDRSVQKLPLTLPSRLTAHKPATAAEIGPKKPNFKLHERRDTAKKLELSIRVAERAILNSSSTSPSASSYGYYVGNRGGVGVNAMGLGLGLGCEMVMASPVSPLDILGRGSPRTPRSPQEEEERAIASKGFYLHPSPRGGGGGGGGGGCDCEPPQLLPLFPLHSPTQTQNQTSSHCP